MNRKIVYRDPDWRFYVAETFNGYSMYNVGDDRFSIASLTYKRTLHTTYKGDFQVWYEKIRQKKKKTIASYDRQIAELLVYS